MNRVVIGLLIGVGVVSGLAVLLLRGEKTQRFLRERWQQLRRTLPEPEHVQQYAQQVADRLSHATSEVKDTTQQAMKRVRLAGGKSGRCGTADVRDDQANWPGRRRQHQADGKAELKEIEFADERQGDAHPLTCRRSRRSLVGVNHRCACGQLHREQNI